MRRILLALVGLFVVLSAACAQEQYGPIQGEDGLWYGNPLDGYLTLSDTFAYQNGDYVVLEDGSIAIPGRPTTEEERREIENEWYSTSKEKENKIQAGVEASKRIAPTRELGLFIVNQTFSDYLFRSRLESLIGKMDFQQRDDLEGIKSVITYMLPGRSRINCYINRFDKIHFIDVIIAASFEDDQDILTMDDLITIVLQATGLPYGWDDIYSAVKSINSRNFWNGWLFGMIATIDHTTSSATIRIMSPYDFNDDDPYEVMKEFEGECDPNYIGACIPASAGNLNCSDVRMRNFFVIGKDKHKFDGDKNGVCCEPYPQL